MNKLKAGLLDPPKHVHLNQLLVAIGLSMVLLTQDDGGDAGGGMAGGAQVDDARTGVGVGVDGHGEAPLPHHREHGGDPGPERVPAEDERVPRVLLQRRVDLC